MSSMSKVGLFLKCGSAFGTAERVINATGVARCHRMLSRSLVRKQGVQLQQGMASIKASADEQAANVNPENSANTSTLEPLTDKFGRHHTYLRISLTERCNLRCKYCMPAEGVPLQPKSNLLTTDEIIYLARIFVEQGVRKIRLTGGEPTVRKDIVEIIERIKSIPKLENVGITTNGLVLTRFLVPMQRAGLDAVNISLDTMRPQRFEEITRRKGWERVIAGIDLAVQLGYVPKINCVLMRNFNDDEICDFVEFTRDRNVDVRFIEYMPFTGNKWQTDKLISYRETLEVIRKRWPDFAALPNGPNDTSKAFKVPDHKGQVGFITSMTEHFCGSCNRLRLTADGNIKVCLFGNKEFSLRDAIRNGCAEEDLIELISLAVKRKRKQHAGKLIGRQQFDTMKSLVDLLSPVFHNLSAKHIKIRTHQYHQHSHRHQLNLPISKTFGLPLSRVDQSLIITKLAVSPFEGISQSRCYCTPTKSGLTHVDGQGKAKMVDVSAKRSSEREAVASATVQVGPQIAQLIADNDLRKGDVLTVAQIAGILGAKKTSELIPLCHNIILSSVRVNAELQKEHHCVHLTATVRCVAQTGVEMEALTAVTIAALTVYDMCKAISHDITITDVRLLRKTGGKSDFKRKGSPGSYHQSSTD